MIRPGYLVAARVGQPRATLHAHRPRAVEQPSPVPNDQPAIVPQVINDLTTRMMAGKLKYGVALQPFNGRDPARDAYEEAQDMTLYLKQLVIEREAMAAELIALRRENATLRARLAG